jgi:hypothetical protein
LSDSGRSLCWREIQRKNEPSIKMDFNDYEFEQRLRTMGGDFLPQSRRGAEEMEVIFCCFSGWDKNIYERMH